MLVRRSKNAKPIVIQKPPSLFMFGIASMFAMFLGSQFVHAIYKPLENLDQLVEIEFQKMLKEHQSKSDS